MIKRVVFDFETRSVVNLKKAGPYKYSLDPSTRPTCLAFKIRGHKTVYFLPFHVINRNWCDHEDNFRHLWNRLIAEDYEFTAHNTGFDRIIYENILVKRYGWPYIGDRQYRCTAAKAAACALPRSLEGAGEALNLTIQKDRRGYQAMMATCKPTSAWNAWNKLQARVAAGERITEKTRIKARLPEPPLFLEPETSPDVFKTLYDYCKVDVRAEDDLDQALPDLIPSEQEVWRLNQKLNSRGFKIDVPTISKIVGMMGVEKEAKLKELDLLTMGLVTKPAAWQSILDFLELEGVQMDNLQAKTVDDRLQGFDLTADSHRLLTIRRALTQTSTKKYYSFLDRVCPDGRARDNVLYHGASTGRDGGVGVNPYNFPRGLIKMDPERPYATVENIAECDPEMLRVLYGDSLSIVFSAVLRNMIIPSPGCELFVADFSKIEVAVLWWLADNEPGLKILRAGLDPYKYQAAANTGKSYDEISDFGDERQLGKAQILGAGFRMGWKRFKETAWNMYRLKLTSRQSVDAIKSYRTANASVAKIWELYEDAAIRAVETGLEIRAGKCSFLVENGFLWITLPSGRKLAYPKPSLTMRAITFTALETDQKGRDIEVEKTGAPKKTLQFMGLAKSKKTLQTEFSHGGILTENIVQATARDLMMPALLRLEQAQYKVLLSVYDEAVCERLRNHGTVEEFVELMCEAPAWAEGLPIEAKGYRAGRYRK